MLTTNNINCNLFNKLSYSINVVWENEISTMLIKIVFTFPDTLLLLLVNHHLIISNKTTRTMIKDIIYQTKIDKILLLTKKKRRVNYK